MYRIPGMGRNQGIMTCFSRSVKCATSSLKNINEHQCRGEFGTIVICHSNELKFFLYMAKVTVSLPQGTRDFGADVVRKRNYIIQCIREAFERYGFQPLETPAMENLETLMGKYGEEGDKLIFKILNNGLDNPAKKEQALLDFDKVLNGRNTKGITERALRYDLTI